MVFVFISGCYCLFFQVGLYTAVRFAKLELPCRGRSCVVFSNKLDKQDFPPYIPNHVTYFTLVNPLITTGWHNSKIKGIKLSKMQLVLWEALIQAMLASTIQQFT